MPGQGVPSTDGAAVPVPLLPVGSAICSRCRLVVNVPVSDRAWFIVKLHVVPVPVHSPVQPLNSDDTSGASVTVIVVPNGYMHVVPLHDTAAWLALVDSV